MNIEDYLWYPYLRYQKQCREEGREDSIQEWLELTGRVEKPKPKKKVTKVKAKAKKSVKKVSATRSKSVVQNVVSKVKDAVRPRRARDSKGRFIKNDPNTSANEAWVGGSPPKDA